MYKTVIPFYILCLGLYIFFTRQPDYTDGEFTQGTIHFVRDSTGKPGAKAVFAVRKTLYTIDAAYSFRPLNDGEQVRVIYEASNPQQAAVYSWWGYWIKWKELIAAVLIPFVLVYAANAITSNPTPEGLIQDMEMDNDVRRRRYD